MSGESQTVLNLGWAERLNVADKDMPLMEHHTANFEHRQEFTVEELLKWHRPTELIWLSAQSIFPPHMPDGTLTRAWMVQFAKDFEHLAKERNALADTVSDLQSSLHHHLKRKTLWQKIQSILLSWRQR